MCSKFKVHLGPVQSYFSSLHFLAEIERVTGIKASPVQFQEFYFKLLEKRSKDIKVPSSLTQHLAQRFHTVVSSVYPQR